MAEIKSTLDLVMERTRKAVLSDEEKAEIGRKELFRKAEALFHRFQENLLGLDGIGRELGKLPDPEQAPVREAYVGLCAGGLSVAGANGELLKAIEGVGGRPVVEAERKLVRLQEEYRAEREDGRRRLTLAMAEALRGEGFWGSAVEPAIEGTPEWEDLLTSLEMAFKGRLDEIRAILKAS
jgi:hypothetical protein